ncbi:MAG: flagellar biosynthesis regulator FlaF [Sphingobium sp.]|nr:flagellar biosynthesis regulator FlaF [Sphingobium sp.]MCP5399375.1 flagellar biosynthesis regulator FlaF [Sphingomonas sp.]
MGVSAYQRTSQVAEAPRTTEHRLLAQVTSAMVSAHAKGVKGVALVDLLHWNREIWSTFGSACVDSANRLPPELRASIISLSLWVDRYSSDIIAGQGDLEELIGINRLIMEGLSAN